jgi:ATP-dependent Lhr-like helicase
VLEGLSSAAADVARHLVKHGASFLGDIAKGARRLPAEVEDALWELVASGLVSGDGVAGLRRLLRPGLAFRRRRLTLRTQPAGRRRLMPAGPPGVYGITAHGRPLPTGRWSLWARPAEPPAREDRLEAWARQLLRRYGVVLRDLLLRERAAPPWRSLLEVYRRLEARGEIRGGRFVDGPLGEQFALPEAVEALRGVRRVPEETAVVVISAADPLNLVGTFLPGARISPFSGLAIAHRNGVPVESGPPGVVFSRLQRSPRPAGGRPDISAQDIRREGSQ